MSGVTAMMYYGIAESRSFDKDFHSPRCPMPHPPSGHAGGVVVFRTANGNMDVHSLHDLLLIPSINGPLLAPLRPTRVLSFTTPQKQLFRSDFFTTYSNNHTGHWPCQGLLSVPFPPRNPNTTREFSLRNANTGNSEAPSLAGWPPLMQSPAMPTGRSNCSQTRMSKWRNVTVGLVAGSRDV
ncbi:hypothetical protein BaRGS_00019143 [Batillaria attramentaria]|uniref:Uncharacterized protein n=1 Tax=Batillaria attramentaria TaxID=370345 RepID=A0ABD0KS16_9CAEN